MCVSNCELLIEEDIKSRDTQEIKKIIDKLQIAPYEQKTNF